MKYHKLTKVQIPIHIEGDKQWLSFRFDGTVDRKRVLRAIRAYFKMMYNHSYKKEHFRRYASVINAYDRIGMVDGKIESMFGTDQAGCWIQQFLEREKELADQDNGDTSVQEDNPREAVI